ncbi:hypothetical protein [Tahibacter soli]|uniref:Uncharacterized protein n=1 Tax=Tahibacter soli TaxID=2983605 RepID=A0A9X3YH62_9GAMM|nr:hypothetical protein [Tahibacter soli]MDC8012279.1 hypothetical protein [Tahibacter soli]
MWKRPRTWVTLALLVLLNVVAWDIRPQALEIPGVIPLYSHQTETGIERIVLRPARFYFDSVWYSYAVALFIGLVLPIALARLLIWLWRALSREKKRVVAAWLVLIVVCNVVAWDLATFFDDMVIGIPLYKSQDGTGNIQYTGILPGIPFLGPLTSYALSFLIGIGLPLAALWFWLRRQRGQAVTPVSSDLPLGQQVLALLALLVVFNVLAWDWAESTEKDSLVVVTGERETRESNGFSRYTAIYYSGVAPGVRFADKGASVLASFFVGEILPLLIAPALFRRRRLRAVPLPPVAGAPR